MPKAGLCLQNARGALSEALADGREPSSGRSLFSGAHLPAWGSLSPGGTSEQSCRPCPAGSFCPSLGLSSPPGSCVAGSECPSDPRASSPMAVLCPQVPPRERRERAQAPRPGEARDPRLGFRLERSVPHRGGLTSPSPRPRSSPQLPLPAPWPPALQSPGPEPARRKDKALTHPSPWAP